MSTECTHQVHSIDYYHLMCYFPEGLSLDEINDEISKVRNDEVD